MSENLTIKLVNLKEKVLNSPPWQINFKAISRESVLIPVMEAPKFVVRTRMANFHSIEQEAVSR